MSTTTDEKRFAIGEACGMWLGGLRYFVLCGPSHPRTVYRLQPDGELEMMLSSGWNKSLSNEMTGLHEVPEGTARLIWERLFVPERKGETTAAVLDELLDYWEDVRGRTRAPMSIFLQRKEQGGTLTGIVVRLNALVKLRRDQRKTSARPSNASNVAQLKESSVAHPPATPDQCSESPRKERGHAAGRGQ
jgi:hypothetical protein